MPAQLKVCPQCGSEYELDQRFCPKDGATLRMPGGESNLVGTVIADRYHIVKKLGEGGMGQVYLAQHVRMKRKSAVKVMNPALVHDHDATSRFNREAENASQIAHANVAAIYDFGETADGLIYLAMEFIDGVPLTKILREKGALPAARAASIAKQVADGLAAAHDLGIVHRDLKPDNIMIARGREGADLVKIVDFGIAKAMQSDEQKVTRTGLSVGTPEYMSPEQLAGDKLDHRTDIYSLGLVAFSMFTGHLPFPSVTSKEALIMRLTDRPRTLAQIKSDVEWPAELQSVMDRALANDSDDRYQNVADFGRDLVRAVQAMPQTALTSSGTLEFVVPTAPTQALATGARTGPSGVATIAAETTQKIATGTAKKYEPGEKGGRGKVWATLVVLLLLGGGGYVFMTQRERLGFGGAPVNSNVVVATPPADSIAASAASPDSVAATDSAAVATTTATTSATPASTPPAPVESKTTRTTKTATASTEPAPTRRDEATPLSREQLDAVRDSIRGDIAEARTFADDGDYLTAAARLRRAQQQLAPLVARYPRSPGLQQIVTQLRSAAREMKSACEAERKISGEEVVCP